MVESFVKLIRAADVADAEWREQLIGELGEDAYVIDESADDEGFIEEEFELNAFEGFVSDIEYYAFFGCREGVRFFCHGGTFLRHKDGSIWALANDEFFEF